MDYVAVLGLQLLQSPRLLDLLPVTVTVHTNETKIVKWKKEKEDKKKKKLQFPLSPQIDRGTFYVLNYAVTLKSNFSVWLRWYFLGVFAFIYLFIYGQ